MLHLHDEHGGLCAMAQDMPHRHHLVLLLVDSDKLLIGMLRVIPHHLQQVIMEHVGVEDGILAPHPHVDDVVLIVVVPCLESHVGRAQCLHLLGIITRLFLNLFQKVLAEIACREIVADILNETIFDVVCHRFRD